EVVRRDQEADQPEREDAQPVADVHPEPHAPHRRLRAADAERADELDAGALGLGPDRVVAGGEERRPDRVVERGERVRASAEDERDRPGDEPPLRGARAHGEDVNIHTYMYVSG